MNAYVPRQHIVQSLKTSPVAPVAWGVLPGLTSYEDALEMMERRVADIAARRAAEQVLLLEHPPLYTAGTSTQAVDTGALPFPLHATGRGGQVTYHGPGQRVAYAMLDLNRRGPDLRAYVAALEDWIIATLAQFGVRGERREDRVGVWVSRPDRQRGAQGESAEDKIAAIGIRVRRWITFHGISLNVAPDVSHYAPIAPCGIAAPHLGMTSLHDLGVKATMAEADEALRQSFETIFGPTA